MPGIHHYTQRKKEGRLHKYCNRECLTCCMDKVIYFIGLVGPVMTIPQLHKIWVENKVAGVSVISWASYAIVAAFWIIYGILHREKPIIFTYCLWFIMEVLVVVGVLTHGG